MREQENILDRILVDVRGEIAEAKSRVSLAELELRIQDALPVQSLKTALSESFGLIAEIKVCSPSMGRMREQNVAEAPEAYRSSNAVKAVSLLTSKTHFGMDVHDLSRLRQLIGKPVLRKDFIIDPYQVYEARAHGADAVLLMSQHLSPGEIQELHELALSLGLEVLLECFTREHIEQAPETVEVIGINSRNFRASTQAYEAARLQSEAGSPQDFTTNLDNFENVRFVRPGAVKVAESGIFPASIERVKALGFNAALIGTSLLMDDRGVHASLAEFEEKISE